MTRCTTSLLTAALLCLPATAALAGNPSPTHDGTSAEQMRQRPDQAPSRSRYPDTGIDKGPGNANNVQPPDDGSAMEMNDMANGVNDSALEMPRPNR